MVVSTDGNMTDDEIAQNIADELAEELNIHPSNIVVSYDNATQSATYVIYSDDAESLVDLQTTINNGSFLEAINEDLVDVTVVSVDTFTNVAVEVSVTVDASAVSDVDSAIDDVNDYFEDNGYTTQHASKMFF